ncbi:MAG: signal peptidase II [Deltaproteobacteria bacterium]|nr:signal peptidase II [Deltaproteobacteria bacterium]
MAAADQLTKALIAAHIPLHRSIPAIPGFFDLTHIHNRGAAFGFLNSPDIEWQFWLFLGATFLALLGIFSLARNTRHDPLLFSGLGLIVGGATGNLVDRLRYRSVLDFLDFYIGDWHWPAFNVADAAICVGAFLACIALYRAPQEKN